MKSRSLQIASDLDSLAKASNITNHSFEVNPTQQAVACCEYIASLGAIAGEEQEEEYRQEAVLRSAVVSQPPVMALCFGLDSRSGHDMLLQAFESSRGLRAGSHGAMHVANVELPVLVVLLRACVRPKVWSYKALSLPSKMQYFRSSLMSVLLYRGETWTVLDRHLGPVWFSELSWAHLWRLNDSPCAPMSRFCLDANHLELSLK